MDNNKKESEKFKKIEDFKSNYKFEWLKDNRIMGDEIPDEIIERRNRWIDDLKKDLYVDEAVNILSDLSSFYLNRLSLQENNQLSFNLLESKLRQIKNIILKDKKLEPPQLTYGRGIPIVGIIPNDIPILIKKCINNRLAKQ